MKHNRSFGAGGLSALAAIAVASAFANSVRADALDFLSANSGETMVFDSTLGPQGEWNIPGADFLDGTASTLLGDLLTINPSPGPAGIVSWTGNGLDQDNSGALTSGTFFGGGTFTLTGQVYDLFGMELTAGPTVLLSGSVGPFGVLEDNILDNALDESGLGALFVPNAGVLHDGTITTSGNFFITFTVTDANQLGSGVEDFQNTINTTDSFQFVLSATNVPEPGSLALMFGGAALVGWRKRK